MENQFSHLEEFRKRIKQIDLSLLSSKIEEPKNKIEPIIETSKVKRFNIHKRSVPAGIDRIVIYDLSEKGAERIIDKAIDSTGRRVFRDRCYENGPDHSKTLIIYDIVPIGAKPKERAIYFRESPEDLLEESTGQNEQYLFE